MALEQQKKIRRNRSEWAEHMAAWKRSGLGQKEYCEHHRLNPCSFSYWKNKLDENEVKNSFIEIMQPIPQALYGTEEVIELTLEGVTIKFRESIDPIRFRNIVIALMGV